MKSQPVLGDSSRLAFVLWLRGDQFRQKKGSLNVTDPSGSISIRVGCIPGKRPRYWAL